MIKIENLFKEFPLNKEQKKERNTSDKFASAAEDVSFNCNPGEVFSLLGPNGAGKTTILRMLSTVIQPSSGSIEICGIDAIKYPREARKKIGFLTGSTGLYARLSAHEIIDYFASLYNVPQALLKERKSYLFDLLGMNDFANKRIGKLSTGMKQKVSICRTMIHDPDVVIFDEPTSGLDVITAESIIQLIRDCRDQNKTVLFSSHIMGEVDLLCDRLAIIHQGKLKHHGTMEDFRAQMTGKSLTGEFINIVQS
jgi:sodium transport system ATP-binding protein|tara:strand:+ start:6651 stop:7409 length:759 start_codon:yes stop_codon:yes gene_type:complete